MFDLVEKTAPPDSVIADFRGQHAFLSNFSLSTLWWEGICYPSVEHAFQAAKTLDFNLRQEIAQAPRPRDAKAMGRALLLRPDWEDVKHGVMRDLLAAKFATSDLAERLVATGTALLVEGNNWCDNQWGWCRCRVHAHRPGGNHLGRALMRQRALCNPDLASRWTRVAATGHRPHKIPKELRTWVQDKLAYVADKMTREHGMEVAISGLAMGTDLWWADKASDAGARVWGYSPHPDQDQRWPNKWKWHRRRIMHLSERVEHLGPAFSNAHLFARNSWMIRDADALVVVADTSRTSGGTIEALNEARDQLPIVLIDLHDGQVRRVMPRRVHTPN